MNTQSNEIKQLGTPLVFQAEEGKLSGVTVASSIPNYHGNGYVTGFEKDGDFLEILSQIPQDAHYQVVIRHASLGGHKRNLLFIDGHCYGEFISNKTTDFVESMVCTTHFTTGEHSIKVLKSWGEIEIDSIILTPVEETSAPTPSFELINKNATPEAKSLMAFLKDTYHKKIITGQHTAAAEGPELTYIQNTTGKLPALRGFDLLSYSLKTDTKEPTEHKVIEINENMGSIEKAIEWYQVQNGIVTFCWHWYSPTGGKDKTFYTQNTNFDLNEALIHGTKEHDALMADIDEIAIHLLKLKDANVPVLWRPLHEADGRWFWWGAKGPEAYLKLYHLLFERLTHHYQLNNLIWVWNAPNPEWYPGDEYIDIAGMDTYVPSGSYGPLKCQFDYLKSLVSSAKPVALTENGPIPDPDVLIESDTHWLWYMPWYGGFVTGGESTTDEQLKKVYNHPYCITLDQLPDLKSYK